MKYVLKLYVIRETGNSKQAISNLKRITEDLMEDQYTVEIIDILKNPKLAADDNIVAVPALIKHIPPPFRKVIGDLSDTEKVLFGLGLRPVMEGHNHRKEGES